MRKSLWEWYLKEGFIQFVLGNVYFVPDQRIVNLAGGKVFFGIVWLFLAIAIFTGIPAIRDLVVFLCKGGV